MLFRSAVMTKVPGMTVVKSRLHESLGEERATELYRCFLLDRLDAVATLPDISGAVAFTPPEAEALMRTLAPSALTLVPQRGVDLGERLSNILTDLLERGHAGAIAVDSDSPTLPSIHLSQAFESLSNGADVVLGPCDDGGYYLIGIKQPAPRLLREVQMSTPTVAADTIGLAEQEGLGVSLLPTWYDVDDAGSLLRLMHEVENLDSGIAIHTRQFLGQRSIRHLLSY